MQILQLHNWGPFAVFLACNRIWRFEMVVEMWALSGLRNLALHADILMEGHERAQNNLGSKSISLKSLRHCNFISCHCSFICSQQLGHELLTLSAMCCVWLSFFLKTRFFCVWKEPKKDAMKPGENEGWGGRKENFSLLESLQKTQLDRYCISLLSPKWIAPELTTA